MKRRLIITISVLMMIIGLVGINTNVINAEDTTDYLCFTAEEANSTVKLTKTGTPADITLQTSTNKTDWSNYTFGNEISLTNIGDKVYFRNISEITTGFSVSASDAYKFVMTGKIAGSGDVTTLINKNGTLDLTPAGSSCFAWLFMYCTSLTTAPNLPATTLTSCCYEQMFTSCTNLIFAPEELPATIATSNCYNSMFGDCTNLTVAPVLLATTLVDGGCYPHMFYNCSSLTVAPELPATTLGSDCYWNMFGGCSSLKVIPNLPATALADKCYGSMFSRCTNIMLSDVEDGTYSIPIRIPSSGSITTRGTEDLDSMFYNTGGPASFGGTPVDSDSDGVITLYLKPSDVTITYDGNGNTGGSTPSSSTYTILDEATIKGNENSLTKTGKVFSGWSLRPDGKGKVYNPDDTFNIRGDMILYARWEDPDYSFTLESGQTYTKGTLENKLFTCDGPLANLTSVKVDDVEITENTQYTKDSGSTKITLLGTYLETLDLGSHTLKLTYSDGPTPTVTFNVVNPSTPEPEPTPAPAPNNNAFVIPNTGIK